jgi:hypothetical protein
MPDAREPLVQLASQVAALSRQLAEVTAQLQRVSKQLAELSGPTAIDDAPQAEPATVQAAEAVAVAVPVAAAHPAAVAATPKDEAYLLLQQAFAAAVQTDLSDPDSLEAGFAVFCSLSHSSRHGTPLLNGELLAYKWKPLVQRLGQYLQEPKDPTSFAVVQWQPDEPDGRTEMLKAFLRADKRMPPPVTFRRDARAGGALRIETSSL